MHNYKHLTAAKVDKFMATTKGSRNQACDRCLLLLRHGWGFPKNGKIILLFVNFNFM
jgi:hypothetical protein